MADSKRTPFDGVDVDELADRLAGVGTGNDTAKADAAREAMVSELIDLVEAADRRGIEPDIDADLLAAVRQRIAERDLSAAVAQAIEEQGEEWPNIALGSSLPDANRMLMRQLMATGNRSDDPMKDPGVIAGAMVSLLKPADELEGMLLTQMVAMHNVAMDCAARASGRNELALYREYLNQGNKASRTFVTLMEALNKHRGKGSQQRVTVEHVYNDHRQQMLVAPALGPVSTPMIANVPADAVTFDMMMMAEGVSAPGGGAGDENGSKE
ncbi:hypothetical protein [Antarcticirhabdus aurantiaca]|uniref:Uncharacterized protein n=1 Tax=Antarcticirhabdus aurantiaca TaxID=2606717 RepID=A0ACD4NMG9_9HYPH|nr:hypothetical protein [Antarcticirhabdus aurantiaca]WAJ28026.1 hypothetical protein OXU80_24895 [Jeongeuplla avenae]